MTEKEWVGLIFVVARDREKKGEMGREKSESRRSKLRVKVSEQSTSHSSRPCLSSFLRYVNFLVPYLCNEFHYVLSITSTVIGVFLPHPLSNL